MKPAAQSTIGNSGAHNIAASNEAKNASVATTRLIKTARGFWKEMLEGTALLGRLGASA